MECFAALQKAESEFTEGIEFGKAARDLRDSIKSRGDKNWMDQLKRLGISYEKARYWIAVVEGRPTQRKKAKEPVSDWEATMAKLKEAVDEVAIMRGDAAADDSLKEMVAELAEIVGCKLVQLGGDNA